MHFGKTLVVAGTAALAAAAPTTQKSKRASKLEFFGVNESGAEFGNQNIPGTLGTDYTWPVTSTIDTLVSQGSNIFRIPILMERIIPTTMTGSLDQTYTADLATLVDYITNTKGVHAIIDPHNFGRYYGEIITDSASFKTFWTTIATQFKNNSKVIFDCNNEPHDMGAIDVVVNLNQACIDGVRAAGATSQTIFVEGTSYSGAWTWTTSGNTALSVLTDPEDKIVYEMHQYLDSDGSGTSDVCVSSTIGSERIAAATTWLRENNKVGILGEFAGGANTVCEDAVKDLLAFIGENTDVWQGALWWGGGPWWGDYIFSLEPPSGIAYTTMLPIIEPLI
ncbi:cellulase [Phlyctema vagabunda]|uniref:cellulase n=1 Tax=Phlyctema vagabunda TaxID=108571 RepID=A0ABR4PFZ4_9HELO